MEPLKDHLDYVGEVAFFCIRCIGFPNLMKFTNFSLCALMNNNSLETIVRYAHNKIIKHVINNLIDINNSNGSSLAVCIMKYLDNDKLAIYLLGKHFFSLELEKLIPLIFQYGSINLIKYYLKTKIGLNYIINNEYHIEQLIANNSHLIQHEKNRLLDMIYILNVVHANYQVKDNSDIVSMIH